MSDNEGTRVFITNEKSKPVPVSLNTQCFTIEPGNTYKAHSFAVAFAQAQNEPDCSCLNSFYEKYNNAYQLFLSRLTTVPH